MPLEPTDNSPTREQIDETTETPTEKVTSPQKETGSTFVQRPTPQATELSSGQSIHDLEEPTADVKTRVRAPSTNISAEWVYAMVDDDQSKSSTEWGISSGEPKEVQISGTQIPERSEEETDRYQETIVTKSVQIPAIPEEGELTSNQGWQIVGSIEAASDQSESVETSITPPSLVEADGVEDTSTENSTTEFSPRSAPLTDTIECAALTTTIEAQQENETEKRHDQSPAERRKRSTPQERVYVVAYQGNWLGTYRSSKRIQNKTAYLRVAEQLAAEIDQFDLQQLKLFKLTEVVLKQPIEFAGAQGYQAFSGGGPTLLQD